MRTQTILDLVVTPERMPGSLVERYAAEGYNEGATPVTTN